MKPLRILLASMVLLAAASTDSLAKAVPGETSEDFSGTIVSLDRDANIIVVSDAQRGHCVLAVSPGTNISSRGQSAGWEVLLEGTAVHGSARGTVAESVIVGD